MDPPSFTSQAYGEVTKSPGDKWAFWYYKPNRIRRDLPLDPKTVLALSAADSALGRLSGVGRLLKEPSMLIQPYLTREALASSRIEGTVASLSGVLQAEANDEPTDYEDVREVLNYQRPLRTVITRHNPLPLAIHLPLALHDILLTSL